MDRLRVVPECAAAPPGLLGLGEEPPAGGTIEETGRGEPLLPRGPGRTPAQGAVEGEGRAQRQGMLGEPLPGPHQDGERPDEVRGQVALNTIFHDAPRPSRILLPVVK